jgi:hypothetical protein
MRENGAFNPYNEACALQPRKVVSDDNSEGGDDMDKRILEMCREIDAAKLATAQEGVTAWAEKLLEDAERYRWLRKEYAGGRETYLAESTLSESSLDKYIDGQMAKTSNKTERWSGK